MRRLPLLLAASAVFALAGSLPGATPAAAADPAEADIAAGFAPIIAQAGGVPKPHPLTVFNNGPATALDVTLTVDTTGLHGVSLDFPPSCTQSAGVATCPVGDIASGGTADVVVLAVVPAGTPVGDAGLFTMSVSSPTPDPIAENDTTESTAIIIDPSFDLVVLADDLNTAQDRAHPGDVLPLLALVGNVGTVDADHVFIQISLPTATTFQDRFSDCSYGDAFAGAPGAFYGPSVVTCAADITLAPGDVLPLFDPTTGEALFNAVVGSNMPGPAEFTGSVAAGAGDDIPPNQGITGGKGTFAAALAAIRDRTRGLSPSRIRSSLVDADSSDNLVDFSVFSSPNTIDLKITTSPVTGAKGDTVAVPIVVSNLGPSDGGGPRYDAIAPSGTTFVFDPGGGPACLPADNPDGGPWSEATHLRCFHDGEFQQTKPRGPVEPLAETFTLRILADEVGTDGSITIANLGVSTERDPSNNVAHIVINAAGLPAPAPGDGGLPVTGARTGVIAGVGGGVLALGVALWLLGRRRRTRTVTTL